MDYRQLGRSGLRVSVLTLGTMTFSGGGDFAKAGNSDVAEARRLVDTCLDAGVNLFDTADIYSRGLSEEILGQALGSRRGEALIATKARFPMGEGPNDAGASRHHIIRAAEASLRRLGTDHLDLFALHGVTAGEVGREEILRALEDLRAAGKVRAFAVAGDQTAAAAALAHPYGVLQLPLPPLAAPGAAAEEAAGIQLLSRARAAGKGLVTHSVFGPGGPGPALQAAIASRRGAPASGAETARLLMARAFALNPEGVVLVSMFSEGARAANLAAAALPVGADPLAASA